MILAEIDLVGYNRLLRELQDALTATGRETPIGGIVKDEARLLAAEISAELGPRNKESAQKRILADVRRVFKDGPEEAFPAKKRHGTMESNMEWLFATPRFLFGANKDDIMLGASRESMIRKLKDFPLTKTSRGMRRVGRGKLKTIKIGERGKQDVRQYNRFVVGIGRTAELARSISDKKIGRLRATFAYAAHRLGHTRIPSWVKKHFGTVASDGRAIYDESKLNNADKPEIVFGSRAPGIEGFEGIIADAVDTRREKVLAKIQRILDHFKNR